MNGRASGSAMTVRRDNVLVDVNVKDDGLMRLCRDA
jgi:hypothetical protein